MIRRIFAALLGSSLFLWTATAANAAQPSGPQGDSWDSLKRLPNWTGVWQSLAGREGNLPLQKGAGNVRSSVYNLAEAPLTPAWHKKIDDLAALRKRGGDVEGRAKYCIFLGFPGGMAGPRSIHEFLLAPGLVLVTDATGFVRRIYTDGRKHHVGPPTMWGDSIGHWEGQTLVVDTVGMQAGNEIEYGLPGGKNMHVVERIYLKPGNPDYMIIDEVLDAPQAFSMPYKFSTEYSKHPAGNPDDKLIEFDCAQNNRDLNDNGQQIMNLTMPIDAPSQPVLIPKSTRGSHKHDGE